MKLEAEFYRDVHALECKYAEKSKALYEKVSFLFRGSFPLQYVNLLLSLPGRAF